MESLGQAWFHPMPQCKLCKKSDPLLNTEPNGLCPACNPVYMLVLKSHVRSMQDCLRLIKESTDYQTKLRHCDIFIETASRLIEYEKLDIPGINPLPSELVSKLQVRKAELIKEHQASCSSAPVEVAQRVKPQTGAGHQLTAPVEVAQRVEPQTGAHHRLKQWGIAELVRGNVLCKKLGHEKVILVEPGGGWMWIDPEFGPDIKWIPRPSDDEIASALLGIPDDELPAVQEFCSVLRIPTKLAGDSGVMLATPERSDAGLL